MQKKLKLISNNNNDSVGSTYKWSKQRYKIFFLLVQNFSEVYKVYSTKGILRKTGQKISDANIFADSKYIWEDGTSQRFIQFQRSHKTEMEFERIEIYCDKHVPILYLRKLELELLHFLEDVEGKPIYLVFWRKASRGDLHLVIPTKLPKWLDDCVYASEYCIFKRRLASNENMNYSQSIERETVWYPIRPTGRTMSKMALSR